MVAVARARCRKAQLQVGDILTQPELLQKRYDVITAFRFLLNVEDDVRRRVLRRLREVIREPEGLLLVNVHGNSHSLRHPAIVWRHLSRECNTPELAEHIMAEQLFHIGATHVHLHVAAQDVPCGTLEL